MLAKSIEFKRPPQPETNMAKRSGVERQSVPLSTKGIKKAKSMAFNNLSNRLDRESQARQFLSRALQTQRKLLQTSEGVAEPRNSDLRFVSSTDLTPKNLK